jgi:hypothetical protein
MVNMRAEVGMIPGALLIEIEVTVSGFFTTHHSFRSDGGHWGKLTFSAFSDEGTFRREDGRELVMRKVRWIGTAHEMLLGGILRGSADRPGLLSRDEVIGFGGQQYRLQPEGILEDSWYLTDGSGTRLLGLRSRGILRQGATLRIVGPLDPDLTVFAYYLVHSRSQEASALAATIAASAN